MAGSSEGARGGDPGAADSGGADDAEAVGAAGADDDPAAADPGVEDEAVAVGPTSATGAGEDAAATDGTGADKAGEAGTGEAGTPGAAGTPTRRGFPWAPWAMGLTGALLAVVLVVGAARPEWAVRAWDRTGLDCGRGLSSTDPQEAGNLWAAWGEGEHEDADALTVQEHRTGIEELAPQLGAVPVGEIPAQVTLPSEDGASVPASVELETQGGLVRAMARGEEGVQRLAALDPSTGIPVWHWDLDESRDAWVSEHGDHLILGNRIVRGHNIFVGDLWTDFVALEASSGERQGCQRFPGHPGYGAGSTEAGLVVGTESWNPMVADEEQETGGRSIQQVTVPDFSQGFERGLPALEYPSLDGMTRTLPQPMATLPDGVFLTYTSSLDGQFPDAVTTARYDLDAPAGATPVEAFSLDSGERLWSHGEPGDRIAFVSGVHEAPGDGSGVLLAELGEFTPRPSDPELGSASVTLRMLDPRGELLWEAPAADVGQDFTGSDTERYLRVFGDVVLVHTAPYEVTALDAATGEELWSIDETADEPQPLWLHEAVAVDGMLFLPGSGRHYMVDARTGENDADLADAMVDARVTDISAAGADTLLVETREYGAVVLQRAATG